MIKISIDLKKLDKNLFKPHANGALYCDLILFENDEPDRFGNDFAVKQGLSQEQRQAGVQVPFVGNGKRLGQGGKQQSPPPQQKQGYQGKGQQQQAQDDGDSEDFPF